MLAVVCATATTFSLTTPLLTKAMGVIFGFEVNTAITICVLLLICAIYTIIVLYGVRGISRLASICSYLFFGVLFYFLILGGETRFIIETGFQLIGNLAQNFIALIMIVWSFFKDCNRWLNNKQN